MLVAQAQDRGAVAVGRDGSVPARLCLVTGAGAPAGRAAIRALRARGYDVVAADTRIVAHEADAFRVLPPVASAEFTSELLRVAGSCGATWLLPTAQDELLIVAQQAPELRRHGIAVFTSAPNAVAACDDTRLTVCRPEFAGGTEYDVIGLVHPDPPFRLLSLDVFAKARPREGCAGNGVELAPCVAGDVADLAVDTARALELTGPVDIDIRRDAAGVPHVLEVKARIGAHAFSAPRLFDLLVVLHTMGHLGGPATLADAGP